MFEVVLTYRPDFFEQIVDRYASSDEAQAVAERMAAQRLQKVIRVWVRQVREVRTKV